MEAATHKGPAEAPDARREGLNDVELGPLFTAGTILLAYGIFRRRRLAVAFGLTGIWLDQRSELGRSLKEWARSRFMTVQYVEDGQGPADESAKPPDES